MTIRLNIVKNIKDNLKIFKLLRCYFFDKYISNFIKRYHER